MTYYANCCPNLFTEKEKNLPKCFKLFFRFDEREQFSKASLFPNKLGSKRWFIREFVNKLKGSNSWGISSKIENEWVLWLLEAGHKLLSLTEKYSLKNHLSFPDFPSWHNLSKEWSVLPSPFPSLPWSCLVLHWSSWRQIHWPSFVLHLQFSAVLSSADHFILWEIFFSSGSWITPSTYTLLHCSFLWSLECSPSPLLNF